RVALHPSSMLSGADAEFVVAAELVEHAKPYAINASVLQGSWIRDLNPEAADLFGLGRRRTGERRAPPITEVAIGDLIYSVSDRRGKPTIDVELSELGAFRSVDPDSIPAKAKKVRVRIQWTKRQSFQPVTLAKLLTWVQRAPFPAAG